MELTQVNNSQSLNVTNLDFIRSKSVEKNDIQPIQTKSNLDKVEYSHSIQSTFSLNLSNSISTISNIQIASNQVTSALKLVNNFEKLVTSNRNSLDSVQPEIQNFISSFNSSTIGLSNNISRIAEEQSSEESRVYFDGILGAKPISGQEIFEAIQGQKQKLAHYNKALTQQLEQTTNQAKEIFTNEKSQSPSMAQFGKTIDFEFESVTFEARNLQQQTGSMPQTQANAQPSTSADLLVAS